MGRPDPSVADRRPVARPAGWEVRAEDSRVEPARRMEAVRTERPGVVHLPRRDPRLATVRPLWTVRPLATVRPPAWVGLLATVRPAAWVRSPGTVLQPAAWGPVQRAPAAAEPP